MNGRQLTLWIICGIVAGSPAAVSAQGDDSCRFEAERNGTVDAGGAALLELVARAGSLVVEGHAGTSEVRVRGRACASSQALLDEIELVAERRGNDIRVEARMADNGWTRTSYAALHLVVEVPEGIAAEIEDSSGPIEIRGLGDLRLTDGSGSIRIDGLEGSLRLRDGSGSIDIKDTKGDVDIDDGSGTLVLRDVGGSVDIRDGSGSVDVRGVGGSVQLSDGSGSIYAADVTGDLTVARDGSGDVRFDRIGGSVRTPRR